MTSRAPSRVAAIVAKLSTCTFSGTAEATGTPDRVTTADIIAPVWALKPFKRTRSSSTATGNPVASGRAPMSPSLFIPVLGAAAAREGDRCRPGTAGPLPGRGTLRPRLLDQSLRRIRGRSEGAEKTLSRRRGYQIRMEEGARLVLTTSAALRAGEKVLVVADDETAEVGRAFARAAAKLDTDPALLLVAPRKRDGDEPPEPVGTAMETSDLVVIVTSRSLTHTHARRQANRAGARVVSIPGITPDMLREGGLAMDWGQLYETMRRTARRLRGARDV